MDLDNKVIELENRISKIEKKLKFQRIFTIVSWIITIVVAIGVFLVMLYFYKNMIDTQILGEF